MTYESKKFKQFVIDYINDFKMRRAFHEGMDDVFKEYDLTDDERQIIKSGDQRIRYYLSLSNPTDDGFFANIPDSIKALPGVWTALWFVTATKTFSNTKTTVFAPLSLIDSTPKESTKKKVREIIAGASSLLEGIKSSIIYLENPENFEILDEPKEASSISIIAQINIIGIGINGLDQLTRKAEFVLSSVDEVFLVGNGLGVSQFMNTLGVKVTDLALESYVEDEDRMKAYHHMASRIIESAMSGNKVAFALYGHPLVFAYPPFIIKALAECLSLSVNVEPGVSSWDTLFTDLFIDPGASGLLVYEASDVLISRRTFLPDVATLVLQIGSLETGLYSNKPSNSKRFARFVDYILKFYPKSHIVYAVSSANSPMLKSTIFKFRIGDMPDNAERLHAGITLYIPPVKIAEPDFNLLTEMNSQEHLRSITQDEA